MTKNVVCYVQRKRITDWKRKVLTRDDSTFIYGSSDDYVFAKMGSGDVLWVVASVPKRPPEIVARLDVELVAPRTDSKLGISEKLLSKFPKFKWFARGKGTSRFFGHNNAERAFMQSTFLTSLGKSVRLGDEDASDWQGIYGKKFRRPLEIAPSGESLFQQITDQPAVFISWKWGDNRKRLVRDLAYALADQGFTVWLDRLAMPASESLRRLANFPQALEILLQDGYRHSSVLLAVESKRYGMKSEKSAKNWTLDEWNGVYDTNRKLHRVVYRPAYAKESQIVSGNDLHLDDLNVKNIARKLREWWHLQDE